MSTLSVLGQVVCTGLLFSALGVQAQQFQNCASTDDSQPCATSAARDRRSDNDDKNQVKVADPVKGLEREDESPRLKKRPDELERKPPTEKPTEFEEFVEQSLGYKVPMFGRDLFSDAPPTFAPLTDVPVPAEYVVGPGDELVIRGW